MRNPMKRDDDSLDLLIQKLRWLRLPGMAQLVASLLEQPKNENLTALEILHRLFDEERASRMKSAVDRRIKDAKFPELSTLTSTPSARSFAPATSRSTTSRSSTRASTRCSSAS